MAADTPNLGLKRPEYKDTRWDLPMNYNSDIMDGILNQNLKTNSSPTFAGITISDVSGPGFGDSIQLAANSSTDDVGGSVYIFPGSGPLGNGTVQLSGITQVTGQLRLISNIQSFGIAEYADNAAALAGGLVFGEFYRTGDVLKIVH